MFCVSELSDHQAAPVVACVGMGSNLGDRAAALAAAAVRMAHHPAPEVVAVSPPIETAPVAPEEALRAGLDPGGAYLNAAAVLRTSLTPRELLGGLMEIEREMGRDRRGAPRWGARTLDLDLLLYGDAVIDEPGLIVPHPRMAGRAFVLVPLAEVAPEVRVPPRGERVRDLLEELRRRERDAAEGASA